MNKQSTYKVSDEELAQEAFIRRAALLDAPFMLKGSFVSRQYFPTPAMRKPRDLDWLYLSRLEGQNTARQVFDEWVISVTEMDLEDGVMFRSFRENQFWRMIDYAMADDFPTVNTDVLCWVEGREIEFDLDISFNLEIPYHPIPLQYQTISGDAFIVPKTVPLSLQVSWKIHQTLVRPRFKDLFDLTYFVQHPLFTSKTLEQTLKALVDECLMDNVKTSTIQSFLNYQISDLFGSKTKMKERWQSWKGENKPDYLAMFPNEVSLITDEVHVPKGLSDFLLQFTFAMRSAGFNKSLMPQVEELMKT
ncbi:MAG: nucleotidyl transferase AbiEii/AbiGii toxin family protein [Bacteroidota bacterium]